MESNEQLLAGHSTREKGAYLGAIASIATADRKATDEELEFLQALTESADLTEEQEQAILQAATDPSSAHLQQSLDILKGSELRYSLITDLIAFAKSDGKYTDEEQNMVQQMASYLNIDANQYSTINQFVNQAEQAQQQGHDITSQNFMQSSGFGDKFRQSGINGSALMSGLIGIMAPMLLSRVIGGRRRRGGMMGGGMMGGGGGLGGMVMGGLLSGVLGGGMRNRGMGGMGGMFDALSGGRGYQGMGGLLGGLLGGGSSRRGGFGF